jgi:predicted ABC-type exoprotein transport system permease subunit
VPETTQRARARIRQRLQGAELDSGMAAEQSRQRSFVTRHGITAGVAIRLATVVSVLMVVGIRFERTVIALAVSAVYVIVFTVLGRGQDEPSL